jgi:predicted XRE-type DNA-binding protein
MINMRRRSRVRVRRGCENVFAYLGVPNARDELIKADLVINLARTIQSKGFGQARVAAMLGITQPQISNLLRGRTYGFSTDRLHGLLTRLGHDVTVRIERACTVPGRLHVVFA